MVAHHPVLFPELSEQTPKFEENFWRTQYAVVFALLIPSPRCLLVGVKPHFPYSQHPIALLPNHGTGP